MKQHVLRIDTKNLPEASPFDPGWGIGLRADDPEVRNRLMAREKMHRKAPRCTTCATGAGAGAGVPSLVGAASPGRRKLPQEFELSALLGYNMTNTCCCCCAVAVCVRERCVFSLFFFASPRV